MPKHQLKNFFLDPESAFIHLSMSPAHDLPVYAEVSGSNMVICKVCPTKGGNLRKIRRHHLPGPMGHDNSRHHKLAIAAAKEIDTLPLWETSPLDIPIEDSSPSSRRDQLDEPIAPLDIPALGSPPAMDFDDEEVPIGHLYDRYFTGRTILHEDYFDEIENLLEQGESLFTCPVGPANDEFGVEMDGSCDDFVGDFGIELQGTEKVIRRETINNGVPEHPSEVQPTVERGKVLEVPPTSPTYPWSTMAVS